jgi:hypothetical protein
MDDIESKLPNWAFRFNAEGLIENFDELISCMDAAACDLKGMELSRFCDVIATRLQSVSAEIHSYLKIVRQMDNLQRQWLLLRGVMESPDAVAIMPDEHAGFAHVNGAWKELLLRASKRSPQVRDSAPRQQNLNTSF